MSIVSRRKTTFFFFLFLLSFFFTKFDARRIKLVQFRIGGVGKGKEGLVRGARTTSSSRTSVEGDYSLVCGGTRTNSRNARGKFRG